MNEIQAPERQERRNEQYRKWYATNRDGFNARRRERYAGDKELREKARENARNQREIRRERGGPKETTVVRNGVEVYRAAAAGQLIGRSPDTIRQWVMRGLIPDNQGDWTHRTYTMKQVKLMKRLVAVMEKYRYSGKYQARLNEVIEYIATHWNG